MLVGNFLDLGIKNCGWGIPRSTGILTPTKRSVAGDHNVAVLAELDQLLLVDIGIDFDLVNNRLDLAISQKTVDLFGIEVGDSDAFG